MEKYRIREKITNGVSEFFPECYDGKTEQYRVHRGGWFSISELSYGCDGYKTYKVALSRIDVYRNRKPTIQTKIIEEKIHEVD